MIRQIDTPGAASEHAPSQVTPATPAGKSFASVLAHQKTGADAASAPKEAITAPEGEVWTPVPGHDHYAKITAGPRAGMYINLARGERRGEVFRIETRQGKRVHVYGDGDSQVVVAVGKDSGKVPAHDRATTRAHVKGETWAPVKGANNYADILSGRRNGLYVNTSGGIRDGMAFQIVEHHGKTFHVYGKGRHRQVIEVGHSAPTHRHQHAQSGGAATSETTATTGTTGATGSTGGAAAPS